MTGGLSVNLGNPLFMFFWNLAMVAMGLAGWMLAPIARRDPDDGQLRRRVCRSA